MQLRVLLNLASFHPGLRGVKHVDMGGMLIIFLIGSSELYTK